MSEAKRDGNYVPTLIGVSSSDGTTPTTIYVDPTTHRVKVDLSGGGSGDVVGPASATDNAIARFDGATGKLLQNSGVTISDLDAIVGALSLTLDASGSLLFGAVTIISDAAGTTTLSNIDAIDATTEGTIETAIDTLPNLTSVQGLTVTLADAGADAILGWDDSASAYENLTQAEVLAVIGDSTATAKGVVELATDAETVTGTDTARATTPANLVAKMSAPGVIGNTTPAAITGTVITANTSFMPDANDGAVLGAAATAFSDLFLASGAVIGFNNGEMEIVERTNGSIAIQNAAAGAIGPIFELYQNSASPAASDVIGEISFLGKDSGATITRYSAIKAVILDPVDTSEDGKLVFNVITGGASADELELIGTALYPTTNDGLALGNATNQFSDIFLAEGGVINFDNGDITFTQTNNELVLAGGNLDVGTNTLRISGDIDMDGTPASDDTWVGPSTNDFNAGATIAQWETVYLSSSSTWLLTDADAASTAGSVMIAIATEAGTNTNPLRVALPGAFVRNDAWNWTVGGIVYLSTTAGALTQTAPSATDDVVRICGWAVNADTVFWDPSPDFITIV